MGRIAAVVLTVLAVAACASAGRNKSGCQPVPTEFQLSEALPVYRDCAVGLRAVQTAAPRVQLPPGSIADRCLMATFDLVVDTTGRVIEQTAKLQRTNNQAFAREVQRLLSELRFQPAEKDGVRVQQLVHYKSSIRFRFSNNERVANASATC